MVSTDVVINPFEVIGDKHDEIVEEILWSAATSAAQTYNVDISSEEFVKIYNNLKKGYDIARNHSKVIAFISLTSLESLLESNTVALLSNSKSEAVIKEDLIKVARVFYATIVHTVMANHSFSGKLFVRDDDEIYESTPIEKFEFVFTFTKDGDASE